MSNTPNYVLNPYDSSGNFINKIIVYNEEQATKTYYSLIQGSKGNSGFIDIGILEEVIRSLLQSDNSLRGIDGVSVNQQDVINELLDYMNSNPTKFRGATGATGLPGVSPAIDYNIIKSQVNTYIASNSGLFVPPINYDNLSSKIDYSKILLNYIYFNTFITDYIRANMNSFKGQNGTNGVGINLISFNNGIMTILMSNSTVYTSPSLIGPQGITGIGISNITFNNGIMTISLTNGNTYTSPSLVGPSATISDSQLSSAINTYFTNNPVQSSSSTLTPYSTSEISRFNVDNFNTFCDGQGRVFTFNQDPLHQYAHNGVFATLAPKFLIKNWTTNSISSMMSGRLVNGTANEFLLYLDLPPSSFRPWSENGVNKYLNFDPQGFTPVGCTSAFSLFCNNQVQTATLLTTPLTDTYFWNYIRQGFYLACDYVQGYIKLRFYDQNKIMFFNFVGQYTYSNANTYLFQFYNNRPTFNFKYGVVASATKTINPNLFDLAF